jgi:predicted acyltransferase
VLLILAAYYYVIDIQQIRGWTFPFLVVGMNSIAMYFLVHVIDAYIAAAFRTHLGRGFFDALGVFAPIVSGALTLAVLWLMLLWMYRRKIFIRL